MVLNWSPDEYKTLLDDYSMQGDALSSELNNRAPQTIKSHAARIGIAPPHPLTDLELELINKFSSSLGSAMCFILPGRSFSQVDQLCRCNAMVQ